MLPRPTRARLRPRARRAALALALGASLLLGLTPTTSSADEATRRYVVQAEDPSTAKRLAARNDGELTAAPDRAGRRFTVELTTRQAVQLARVAGVVEVVPDVRVRRAPTVAASSTSATVPWGLDRIDQRSRTLDGVYRTPTTGEGVVVAVIDSGINAGHREFEDRVLPGWDYVWGDDTPDDCDGHGTHVAATAAGAGYGAAPDAWVLPLRVFDCRGEGWASDVLAALEDVKAYAAEIEERVVVNFSGGGPVDEFAPLVEKAVDDLYRAGVPVVTAAGNTGSPACSSSPGRVPAAINVAASDTRDRRAPWSDRDKCVDLFAPGVGIRSAWKGTATASQVLDGTSMAAPHVTGVVARFLQRQPRATTRQVWAVIRSDATLDVVGDPAGSPNRLLYADVDLRSPSSPTTFAVTTDHAAASVRLTWKAPLRDGGLPLTHYRVTRSGTDARGTGFEDVIVPATELGRSFRYLVPGRPYTFTVQAVNALGRSSVASKTITVVAKPGRPATPVTTAGVTTDSAVSVTVAWRQPTGGTPTNYRVTVRRTDTGTTKSVTVAGDVRKLKVTGLSRDRSYVATVTAVNVAGSAVSPTSAAARAR